MIYIAEALQAQDPYVSANQANLTQLPSIGDLVAEGDDRQEIEDRFWWAKRALKGLLDIHETIGWKADKAPVEDWLYLISRTEGVSKPVRVEWRGRMYAHRGLNALELRKKAARFGINATDEQISAAVRKAESLVLQKMPRDVYQRLGQFDNNDVLAAKNPRFANLFLVETKTQTEERHRKANRERMARVRAEADEKTRKEQRAANSRACRARKGSKTRVENLSKTRPWEAVGISRRT
jgi:hypothetical protein